MWSAQEVAALRQRLNLSIVDFARLVGVTPRTVSRWENPGSPTHPTGAAEAVLNGLREKLDKDPSVAGLVAGLVVGAAAVGGLAYLLVKLLDHFTDTRDSGGVP